MTIWFTSDTHFGHTNIIRYCNRPFQDTHEMNKTIVENWNACVQDNDTVWHLGDVTFGNPTILHRLKGIIHLCLGNHDKEKFLQKTGRFASMTREPVISKGSHPSVLFHYPMESWPGQSHKAIHLHGHSHGKMRKAPNRFDVGVDCFGFKPVTLEEILAVAN